MKLRHGYDVLLLGCGVIYGFDYFLRSNAPVFATGGFSSENWALLSAVLGLGTIAAFVRGCPPQCSTLVRWCLVLVNSVLAVFLFVLVTVAYAYCGIDCL